MALCILKKAIGKSSISPLRAMQLLKNYSLYTPDYFETMKPKIPMCPVINIQIKGYAYPIIENYQRLIHVIAKNMDIDIDNSYAVPAKKLKINRYKPFTATVEAGYELNIYERNTQVSNLPSPELPIFIRLIEAGVPEGVSLNIDVWNAEMDERRYIPDKALMDMKVELEGMRKKKS